jgi:hypothetical protein
MRKVEEIKASMSFKNLSFVYKILLKVLIILVDYRYANDEIFKRMKVATFVQLVSLL